MEEIEAEVALEAGLHRFLVISTTTISILIAVLLLYVLASLDPAIADEPERAAMAVPSALNAVYESCYAANTPGELVVLASLFATGATTSSGAPISPQTTAVSSGLSLEELETSVASFCFDSPYTGFRRHDGGIGTKPAV
jgi:hypothetical protein